MFNGLTTPQSGDPLAWDGAEGIALCEQLRMLDLRVRGYKKSGELKTESIMDIADAIQSIFDYYPYGAS